MSKAHFIKNLEVHLKAGVKAIYVESSEWRRLNIIIHDCCNNCEKSAWFWNNVNGFYSHDGSTLKDIKDITGMLKYIRENNDGGKKVYVIEFADRHLIDKDVAIKFAVTLRSLQGSHIIALAPTLDIPDFLKKEFSVLDFPLPEREEIGELLKKTAHKFNISEQVDSAPEILDSVRGLGSTEIRNAFAKAAVTHKKVTAEQIKELVAEKEQIIRKTGYLNFIRPDSDMKSVGGLNKLREWLEERKKSFGEKARKAKLNPPKGVLLLGIPGTGKSLCAKAAAAEWNMPLLRLDMGSIYSKFVGDSEANMRNAIKVAESLAPCVLWIDEIEKGLSGGASQSGELSGGASVRVFGSLLTWMQEKDKEVFVFATANNIESLPPEFLRKGRFDEIFFVDLPGKDARKSIFRSHLKKKGQDNDALLTKEVIEETHGFSGAEIESVVNEALFKSYNNDSGAAEITVTNLRAAAKDTVSLWVTMYNDITKLRDWAEKSRCRLAADAAEAPVSLNKVPPLHSDDE